MNPLRFLTLTAAAVFSCAPLAQAAPLPDPWPQTAQEKASADEAARAAKEAARAASQAVRETVREVTREVERQKWQGEPGRGEPVIDTLSKVVKVAESPTVIVMSFSGDIRVSTGGPGEVRIEARRRTRHARGDQPAPPPPPPPPPPPAGSSAPAAQAPKGSDEDPRVSVEERGGRVEIRAWSPRGPARAGIDFDIVVPAAATVELKSLSGNINVTGVKGAVTAESMSGDIAASALAGVSILKTVSGDVLVGASAVSGDVTASSVSGDVTAKGVKARWFTAGTVSGNVAVQDASCERASVKSVSGNVEVGGALPKSARYEVKSHSGNVRVVVDGKTGFEVDVTTWSGAIANDFGIKNAAPEPEKGVAGFRQKTLQGVYGDGSAQIEAESFSGNVSIVKPK